jgi:alpha-tubulin suppressor-like RCC1 family protein
MNMVTSGGQHSAAIDINGRLYVCGSYLHGKLGIDDLASNVVLSLTPVTQLKNQVVK